jgi:hypothetical protein
LATSSITRSRVPRSGLVCHKVSTARRSGDQVGDFDLAINCAPAAHLGRMRGQDGHHHGS